MKKLLKASTWDLYHMGMSKDAWEKYSDSDFIICFDCNNVWYLFIGIVSDSNFIMKSETLYDIEQFIMEV